MPVPGPEMLAEQLASKQLKPFTVTAFLPTCLGRSLSWQTTKDGEGRDSDTSGTAITLVSITAPWLMDKGNKSTLGWCPRPQLPWVVFGELRGRQPGYYPLLSLWASALRFRKWNGSSTRKKSLSVGDMLKHYSVKICFSRPWWEVLNSAFSHHPHITWHLVGTNSLNKGDVWTELRKNNRCQNSEYCPMLENSNCQVPTSLVFLILFEIPFLFKEPSGILLFQKRVNNHFFLPCNIILALWRLRQADHEFKVSLGYTVKSYLKII